MNVGLEPVDPLAVMLDARSVALVGASPRPGSLGARMVEEVGKSSSRPRSYLVNPRYAEVGGVRCCTGLGELPEQVDLALLAVPDDALEEQVRSAAAGGARSAVIFGSAFTPAAVVCSSMLHNSGLEPGSSLPDSGPESRNGALRDCAPGLRMRIAAIARDAGMPVCGAGCMGFVNVARGLRAIGYIEPDPLPAGPVALVTHSGSVFSALLRTRRAFGFTVAVSSGQELVTPAAAYARYALSLPETKVLALVMETIRDAAALRAVLADLAARAGHPCTAARRGHVGGEPVPCRRAFRRPGGGRRRLAGPGVGVRRAPRGRPGGTRGHPGTVLPHPAAGPGVAGARLGAADGRAGGGSDRCEWRGPVLRQAGDRDRA